ncbi:MAG: HEAT repeat domain-containing protein [Chloroflexota bacterium]
MSDPNNADLKDILSELRDTNKDKRRTAVMKLGMLGGDDAIRALIRTLENEYEDLIVRGRAAMMLGKVGDRTAVAPLIRALDAPGYKTPLYAVEALGLLGDARAIMPLVNIAENGRDRLQEAALSALEKLGHTPDEADYENDLEVEPLI